MSRPFWKSAATLAPSHRLCATHLTNTSSAHTRTKMSLSTKCDTIDSELRIEEETVRGYRMEDYYPVKIGELFQDRYRVIGKLGYGSASTVWLCHDLRKRKTYVALKVYIHTSQVHRELPVYNHINNVDSCHHGRSYIRRLLDNFEVQGPDGIHTCLVHEALGMNLEEFRELIPGRTFAPDLLRQSLRGILHGMDFLHRAGIVHTDIQPKNILLGVLDNSAFERYEQYENESVMPRKELPSRTIFMSRLVPLTKGAPCLCDLSEARFDNIRNKDLVMPDVYRAPEVVLGMPWSYPIDIWGLAMTLWDLFEPKRLFSPRGEDGLYSEEHHLAQMVSIMGPPPLDFLERSNKSQVFWDAEGRWKGAVPIPETSLVEAEKRLDGEEQAQFINFLKKMLQWNPGDRSSLEDVFMDEWLLADLIASGEVVRE